MMIQTAEYFKQELAGGAVACINPNGTHLKIFLNENDRKGILHGDKRSGGVILLDWHSIVVPREFQRIAKECFGSMIQWSGGSGCVPLSFKNDGRWFSTEIMPQRGYYQVRGELQVLPLVHPDEEGVGGAANMAARTIKHRLLNAESIQDAISTFVNFGQS